MEKTSAQEALYAFRVKHAFAVSDEGHKYDAEAARLQREYLINMARLHQKYDVGAAYAQDDGKAERTNFFRGIRFGLSNLSASGDPIAKARHQAYTEKMHRKGENAMNPFGGMLTPLDVEGAGAGTGITSNRGRVLPEGEKFKGRRKKNKLTDL